MDIQHPATHQFYYIATTRIMISVDLEEYELENGHSFDPAALERELEKDPFIDPDHEMFLEDGVWSTSHSFPFVTKWDTRMDLDMIKLRDQQIYALNKQIEILRDEVFELKKGKK